LRIVFKAVAFLALLFIVGVLVLFGTLWLERRSELTLSAPTGSFPVGRTMYAWGDDTPDRVSPIPGTKRELIVWIWYPSGVEQSETRVTEYLPETWRAAFQQQGSGLMRFLTRDLSHVHAHAIHDIAVSAQEQSYPVVIMRGGASANVTNYSTLAEDLASHGYVVVGIDAPYRTNVVVFPDGRVVTRARGNNPEAASGPSSHSLIELLKAWTADIGFVLDRLEQLNSSDPSGKFKGLLDMTRVGVFGHSFGGSQSLQFCSEDARCKAGIDIDGMPLGSVVQTGLHQPFMFLLSDHSHESDPESRRVRTDIHSIYDRLPPEGRLLLEIRGANHFTFSDDGALLKSRLLRAALRLFGKLNIDGGRQLAITTYCVHTFFDAHLKSSTNDRRGDVSFARYPEIQVLN
jgi:dienelactone hydrolase